MKIYLIDTENVGVDWLYLLQSMNWRSRVVLFYTKVSPCVSIGLLERVAKKKIKLEYVECVTGPAKSNALDFQLCTELGYRIRRAPSHKYVIVSNDAGYDPVVSYWAARGIHISRYAPLRMGARKPVSQHQQDMLDVAEAAVSKSKKVTSHIEVTLTSKEVEMLTNRCRKILIKHKHISARDHTAISALLVQTLDQASPEAIRQALTCKMEHEFGAGRTQAYLSSGVADELIDIVRQVRTR